MNKTIAWIFPIVITAAVAVGGYFFLAGTDVLAQNGNELSNGQVQAGSGQNAVGTIAIQPANTALGSVSAAGNIALVSQRAVTLGAAGEINEVLHEVGDHIQAGESLFVVDASDLEREVRNAELSVAAIQNEIDQLMEPANVAEITLAEAALKQAQENLDAVLAGPSEGEIAAAQSSLTSAWAKYNELQAGPSQAELTQLSANLKKTEIALAEAQRAYDQVSWQNNSGTSSQAATLQSATIDYESANAAYEQSVAAVGTSELQSALSAAQNAQVQLDALLNSPTDAEIATAQAALVEAQTNLDELRAGATDNEIKGLEISLEQALLNLESAHSALANATVVAPIAGTLLSIDVNIGESYSEGAIVAAIADTQLLELTIDVAEVDIAKINVGQNATVEIDALAGQSFSGLVKQIAPAADDSATTVSYPVTIRLDDESLEGILPGMTAVATIIDDAQLSGGWLVPTNAIRGQGDSSFVTVVSAEGITSQVSVNPGAVRGEWTIVESSELQAGLQVQGSLTSFVSEEGTGFGPGGGRGFGGGAGGLTGGAGGLTGAGGRR